MDEFLHVDALCQCSGKRCTKCKILLCIGQYTKDKRLRSGLKSKCKICGNAENKLWREENREYDRQRHQTYRQANIEAISKREKAYRQRNRDKIRERERKYWSTRTEQKRANVRRSYWKNRDKILQRTRLYYIDHKIEMRARDQARRQTTTYIERMKRYAVSPERKLASQRRYQKHRKRLLTKWKAYYYANRPYMQLRQRAWLQNNLDKHRARMAKRRTLKSLAGGSFSASEWEELKSKYDYACLRCGKREPEVKLSADHVIPVTKGGHSFISNIQPLCKSCNSSKGSQTIDYR